MDAGKGEKIPTLMELLQLMKQHPSTKVLIEVKDSSINPNDVIQMLNTTDMMKQVIVICFDVDVLIKFRAAHATIELGILYSKVPNTFCKDVKRISATNIGVHYTKVDKKVVTDAEACGCFVWSWSPVTEKDIIKHCEMGVRMICSDNPSFTQKVVNEWWNKQ